VVFCAIGAGRRKPIPIKTENTIKLRDGRTLGYAEYGDPNGRPVLHFHGFPSSRYEECRTRSEETAVRLHARVIVVERPGFGLSDFQSGRTVVDWPDDVVEFADALHLDRFAVTGYSGGSPYVAACAWKIPRRLLGAGIISGVSPLDASGAFDGMNKTDRLGFVLARRVPWLLRIAYWWVARDLRHDPVKFFSNYSKDLSEPDRAAFAQGEVLDMFGKMAIEAFRSGARGVTWDNVLCTRPWGFSLRDITIAVYHWQGEADNVVPPSQGQYLATTIPNCKSKFYPNEGHISLFTNHYEEILCTIVG
jgi:pimeloyl-ACP methyl ester carboxylesterase